MSRAKRSHEDLGEMEQKVIGVRQNNKVKLEQGQCGLSIRKTYLSNGICLTLI